MKFKNLYIKNYKLCFSLIMGFTFLNIIGLFVVSNLTAIIQGLFSNISDIYQVIDINQYLVLTEPIVFLSTTYLIFKFVNNNNPYLLSLLIATLSGIIITSIRYLTFNELNIEIFIESILSIFVLIFTWIIFIQTQKNRIKALSTGFLSFLIVSECFYFIQTIINESSFEILSFIFSICLAGFISIFFGFTLKLSFKILGLENEC